MAERVGRGGGGEQADQGGQRACGEGDGAHTERGEDDRGAGCAGRAVALHEPADRDRGQRGDGEVHRNGQPDVGRGEVQFVGNLHRETT